MIRAVFASVAYSLLRIGRKTGLTYNEVNVLVYYLLIPLSWAVMFDFWVRMPVDTAAVLLVWAGIFIAMRHRFREWCDRVFMASVDFLNWFNRWRRNFLKIHAILSERRLPSCYFRYLTTVHGLQAQMLIGCW